MYSVCWFLILYLEGFTLLLKLCEFDATSSTLENTSVQEIIPYLYSHISVFTLPRRQGLINVNIK
jgi:hypothetical protein